MTIEPSDRTIILHPLRGAIPERADEISRLWTQYGHAVDVAPSTKGVTMNADASRIQFDTKTIDLFWLYGFNAWHAIEVYAPALDLATVTGISPDQALKIDEARGPFEFDYKQRIASAQSLIAAEQTADIDWPDDVPQPTADRDGLGDAQHMIWSRWRSPSRYCTNSSTSDISSIAARPRRCPKRRSPATPGPETS